MPPEHSKKRNRITLSCNYCKRRKVKCDRGQPCSSCVKYNVPGLCEYNAFVNSENQHMGELPPFTVQSSNGLKKSKFDVNNEIMKSQEAQDTDTTVHSELEMLKDKIRQIEASITVSSLSQQSPNFTPPTTDPYLLNATINNNNSVSRTHNNPIQLPPLTWHPSTSSTPRSISAESNLRSEQSSNTSPLHDYSESNTKYVGINPFGSSEETINFYEGYTPVIIKSSSRRMNFGPFAWISIVSKDIALRLLWKYAKERKVLDFGAQKALNWKLEKVNEEKGCVEKDHTGKINQSDVESRNSQEAELEKEFREKTMDRDGYNDIRLYNNILDDEENQGDKEKRFKDEKQRKINMNKNAISLGLTVFEGQIDQELKLIDKIKVVLPKQRVIWILINKFFLLVYPFLPFIDESYFKSEMSRILGPEDHNDSKISELNIEKRLDLANIGILLIIIRFTYLSLFSNRNGVNENNLKTNDPSSKAQELKYLLSNPINIDVIHMAQLCLDQFELLRKTNLVVLQCALIMRLYHMFSPEDGDGADGGDSQIYSGMLIQMAYSMGLNREPDNFPEACNDEKVNNIGRKIWLFLALGDFNQAYSYGNPLCIDDKYVDTKLPYYKPGNENILDIELEKNVVSTFAYFSKFYEKLKTILDLTLSVKDSIKMEKLTRLMSDFEKFTHSHYGTLNQFFIPFKDDKFRYPFIKIMKCKNYINLTSFNMIVFYHFFLHYEKRKQSNLSFFYLKKIYTVMLDEFVEGIFQLVEDNNVNFGEGADLIMNPSLEQIIHKSSQVNFAICIRLKLQLNKMSTCVDHDLKMNNDYGYQEKHLKLSKLVKYIQKLIDTFMTAMTNLSKRYYYAWKVTKAYRFLLEFSGFDEFVAKECDLYITEFSVGQVDELSRMCEASLRRLHKSRMSKRDTNTDEQQNESQNKQLKNDIQVQGMNNNEEESIDNVQIKPSIPLAPGMSVESLNSLNFEELEFINNNEIDRLWMQMVSMKNEANSNPGTNDELGNQGSELHSQTPGNTNPRTPFDSYDFNENSFDLLRDIHLDQIFDGNY
ncbi:DEHA2E13244p [Debaryomyces hansenii CBS767]|uniref:DEHA2E13244p n=1 Tax=Debaryomyces hansenii (strain ATCC 36239 / CBS 767 / BCRC 21394 / JCM 1990 / NBRC 0083 / IGC 2968) TaxID=284592 RepID=B5RU05_DEBHA|nr:DEHA2E13244p [Debaryomyces hansenii CBS767]CAR65817.1 DEHA2E13244p [Debaryomyces hansenii CBS767]|eukprot:XP_002770474.1 DEHA2E13244p [Debaryomyces hansenii CBS767]